ncbi:uncharacterized protein MEPE_06015 [Melanopsichium pennsylvanicum]|uniref:RNI-like protein n=2 Tax=Melanopsichium pennsylvanicum TaxID=63383 RepID=A0AAJ4XR44_9BASI|nr:rni-like protein [Melanopsichium pennsylvanicum 4]SNX87305.1 uncharacterized protein MEPE_06015 [Melanopsichium pennsylvanicum]
MSAGTGSDHAHQALTLKHPTSPAQASDQSMLAKMTGTSSASEVKPSESDSETIEPVSTTAIDETASSGHVSNAVIPGAFDSATSTTPSSLSAAPTAALQQTTADKLLHTPSGRSASNNPLDTAVGASCQQLRQMAHPGPSLSESELASSMITTVSPVRRSVYKRKTSSTPKGILKPAPPPQKGFSFRRDILQNINTRLAQQGVNVQVPLPQGSTAQATASYIGGMFRKIGGIAAGAAANVSGSNATTVGGLLSNDSPTRSNGSSIYTSAYHANSSDPSVASTTPSATPTSLANESDNASSPSLVKSTVAEATTSAAPLKKVQFQVSHMAVTYPIAGAGTPEDEDLTRLRIEREHRRMLKARRSKPWTPQELEALYRECCRTREEHPLKKMRLVFQEAAQTTPPALKTMDLSFVPLDRHAVEPIADLLSVDFGLNKLVLENCALTDDSVKSILHALLVSGTLPNLSIASNRKIRFRGWRYVAIFMRRARALRYLDLSANSIDRTSLEHLLAVIAKSPAAVMHHRVLPRPARQAAGNGTDKSLAGEIDRKDNAADDSGDANDEDGDSDDEFFDDSGEPLMPTAPLLIDVSEDPNPPSSAIISLRLENCGLKAASLEMLSQAVRFSDIRHLSLRRNKIGQLASVALAIMLKDYPDSVAMDPSQTSASTHDGKAYFDSKGGTDLADRSGRKLGPTDGTPERRQRSYSPGLPEVPVIVSSPGGGITSRRMPGQHHTNGAGEPRPTTFYGAHTEQLQDAMQTSIAGSTGDPDLRLTPQELLDIRRGSAPGLSEEEAIAIHQAKRARRILVDLPRVGNLLTLDLKSNDIRGGVVYLAQVLKKNRTLRVLNLSDNNIEMPGLVAVAEALRYNSTLETLDMSHNPCSGPGLEGITTLRTAFALNSNLKRLFLNDTDLSSEAAIALAEFLPEARSLIHLDLAENFDIDIAGVMALAVSLRMNRSLRCLDLNIPPNNPDFARLSQEILQSCVRNTEHAQQRAKQKGLKQPIAAPIYKSVVARAARENDERLKAIETARATAISAAAAKDRATVESLLTASTECHNVLRDLLSGEEKRQREAPEQKVPPPGEFVEDLTQQSAKLRRRLADLASTVEEESLLERILSVHDELGDVSTRLERFYKYGSTPIIDVRAEPSSGAAEAQPAISAKDSGMPSTLHLSTPDQGNIDSGLSSPAFSIADSDESDSDDGGEGTKVPRKASKPKSGKSKSDFAKEDESPLSDMMGGLRINTAELEVGADRENPNEAKGRLPPRSPTENLAKGQLSEEGELFRKARSLGLDGRDSEDEEDGNNDAPSGELESKDPESNPSDVTGAYTERNASNASSTGAKDISPMDETVMASVHDAEISGEQLRKDLLKVDVPPKNTIGSNSSAASTP